MSARINGLLSMLLGQLPAVLTLSVLGGVALWGYAWDWKVPRLAVLLGRADDSEKTEEGEKKENAGEGDSEKPLPLVKLASEDSASTAGIKVAAVEQRLTDEQVTANGEIDFDQTRYAHLSSRASGTVWSVEKQAGDEVKKGDVLALIACPELGRIKFDFQQTMLLVEARDRIYRRMLDASNSIPAKQIYDAETSLREARIHLFGDQQSLLNLGLAIRPEDLAKMTDEQVAARLRTLGIPDSLLRRMDSATLTSNLLPMYAPFDGTVVKRDIVIGEIVNTTTPQFTLADLHRLWIMLNVRIGDASKVAVGQEVAFRIDGADEDAPPGRVTWVSAEVDEKTRMVAVRAEVPNPAGRLKALPVLGASAMGLLGSPLGQGPHLAVSALILGRTRLRPHSFGHGRIRIAQHQRVLAPTAAVQVDGRDHLVFVQRDPHSLLEFQPVRVRLGARHGEFTEILEGLRAGQIVATAGSHALLSEMRKDRISGED